VITEESPKPSVDDEPSVQTVEPPTTAPKKIQRLDSISDDEIFSSSKKKETPTAPLVENKETINTENENLKTSIKERSVREKLDFVSKKNIFINLLVSSSNKSNDA
jgi:hypothetical protein